MFPPTTTGRPKKRSLRELVRSAVDTAAEFATLGEAQAPERVAPRIAHRPHARPPAPPATRSSPAQAQAQSGHATRTGLRLAGTPSAGTGRLTTPPTGVRSGRTGAPVGHTAPMHSGRLVGGSSALGRPALSAPARCARGGRRGSVRREGARSATQGHGGASARPRAPGRRLAGERDAARRGDRLTGVLYASSLLRGAHERQQRRVREARSRSRSRSLAPCGGRVRLGGLRPH